MHLHKSASATGASLISHDTLGSTNAEALSLARAGERGPLWITAARQTAGRGRRGNVWTSEPGNLHASLLLTDNAPAAHLPELCFVAALAVRDAVGAAAPSLSSRLRLKWPNDLLLDGAKLAGILIEAESVGGKTATVAGIGINCAHHPHDAGYPATDLSAHGRPVTPDALFRELSGAMVCASCPMESRRGLRRHPRRVAVACGRESAAISSCGFPVASSPARSRPSTRRAG